MVMTTIESVSIATIGCSLDAGTNCNESLIHNNSNLIRQKCPKTPGINVTLTLCLDVISCKLSNITSSIKKTPHI